MKSMFFAYMQGKLFLGCTAATTESTVFPRIIAVPRIIAPSLTEIFEIIAPLPPSCHLLFLLSPPCQVDVQCGSVKPISDDSSSEN